MTLRVAHFFPETCLFGDQPQPVRGQGVSCTDLIAADQTNCYNYDQDCCETCGVVSESYSNLTGKIIFPISEKI